MSKHPVYSAYLVSKDGTKYDLTPIMTSVDLVDGENQLAQSASVGVVNVKVNGHWMTSIAKPRDRVFIYADDGETKDEVFRGYVWSRPYRSSPTDREMILKCYDQLIYFQQSEEYEYFSAGKSTSGVISELFSKWGVQLDYRYESITHEKLALRGTLADIITSDVLDLAKDRSGKKYTIRSAKDKVSILAVGQNTTVYHIQQKQNAVMTNTDMTMDNVVTKVVILGKAGDDERTPIEATVDKNTADYGTLQKIIDRDENTSLADAKTEAQKILDKQAKPSNVYEITAVDIPWIRKGDKIKVTAGDIYMQTLIVTNISRDITSKRATMMITAEDP